jgi:type VI secretion system secreted protein Hcp
MAIDTFLDLSSGSITGESTDSQFPGQIEIESWSVGGSNPPDLTSAKGGAGTGRVTMNYLNFTVKQTAATVHFFDRLVQGTHIPTAVLTCRKAGGGQEKFHQITLKEAYVAQHQLGGSAGSESNTESFSLAYGSIKQEYFKQGTNGTTTSAGAKTWDLRKNLAS